MFHPWATILYNFLLGLVYLEHLYRNEQGALLGK
jgi:hypothetical protein